MAMREHCDIWRGLVWSAFFHASFLLITPGVGALKFLQDPPQLQGSHVGWSVDYNCTTDDPNATVSLLQSNDFGFSYNVMPVTPNKLLLRKQVFTIVNLILLDGGNYKCKATDQSGQTIEWNSGSMLFILAAQLPRHFVLIPNKSIYVLRGQSGEVTCEAEGPSVSTLKWKKEQDDKSYAAVPNRQVNITKDANYVRATLKITNAQFADTGTYKCTVSVPAYLSDYKLTKIEVKAPSAPTISPYTGQTEIPEGATKAIKCVAEGYPKPTVDWYRNGKKMNVTNCRTEPQSCDQVVYEVYEEGDSSLYTVQVLKIRSALYPRDVGEFKCVASNGVSPDAELIVSLDVQVKPTLKERLDAVAVVEDTEAKVSCTVTKSNPLPTFSWQYAFKNLECDIQQPPGTCVPKENKWITVPSQLVFPSSSTPTNESIVNVAKDQQNAFYRCQAFNSLGNDSQILRFIRLVKPERLIEIDTGKTMTEVNEKSTLQVFCIDRINGDWGLLFSKDGEKIELSDPRVNVTIFENQPKETERLFKLTIKNVTMNDTGEYGCTLSILFPKFLEAINVTVKAPTPPRITAPHDAKTIVVQEGSTKVLKCVARGAPKPNVTWYKNGKQLHTNDRSCKAIQAYKVYDENEDNSLYTVQVLRIRSVLYPRDQGEFKCVASNDVTDVQTVFNVQVQVDLVKRLKLRPPENISVLQGQEARIKCDLDGSLTAELEWKKQTISGDVPVPERMVTVIKDSSNNRARALLKIKFAQMEDNGVYKCVSTLFGKTHVKLAYVTERESLVFLNKPPRVIRGRIGQSVVINCSTNDVDAKVSLLRKPHPFAPSTELKPKANKLTKERQVFTIQNIDIGDAGIYSCGATSGKNQTIKWPRLRGYFVFLQ